MIRSINQRYFDKVTGEKKSASGGRMGTVTDRARPLKAQVISERLDQLKGTTMKEKFSLLKGNVIFVVVVSVISILYFIGFSEKTPFAFGELTGKLICYIAIPGLFGWIVCRIANSNIAGNTTFGIVIAMVLMGQITQHNLEFAQSKAESEAIDEMYRSADTLKKDVLNADDSTKYNESYNKFSESFSGSIDKMSNNSPELQKRALVILKEFFNEMMTNGNKWSESYDAVHSSRMVDYSTLTDDREFSYRRDVVKKSLDAVKSNQDFMTAFIPELKRRMAAAGENNRFADGIVRGASAQVKKQKPILDSLIKTHEKFGTDMTELLNFLQTNKANWKYSGDKIVFTNNNFLNEFNRITEEMRKGEETINSLTDKMVEGMPER